MPSNCKTCGKLFISNGYSANCDECKVDKSKHRKSKYSKEMIERFKSRGVEVPVYIPNPRTIENSQKIINRIFECDI